jgi:activator of HSP90 ATPase
MPEQQLNVWIPEAYKNALAQRAKQEDRSVKAIIVELIEQDIARQQGNQVEQQSVPLIREVVITEVRKAVAQLRQDLLEDIRREVVTAIQTSHARLSKSVTRTVRDSGIMRRLLYALVAKTAGTAFAGKAYQDAMDNTIKELSNKTMTPYPPSPVEEQEAVV